MKAIINNRVLSNNRSAGLLGDSRNENFNHKQRVLAQ